MYRQSLWFRSSAADPSARGIFYPAIGQKKVDDNLQVNMPLTTAAAPKVERERGKAQAMRAKARAQPTPRAIAGLGYLACSR
jgi:hypothetical protein